ncbi:MAG: phosphoribosyltransferase-like protein [Vibrio casei]|uniref:phosphoribosyltransferase-like protein n=1 Tax=Vibrio casei TaxID=673372 RepID=UPI003F9BE780
MEILIRSISGVIKDYRDREFGLLDEEHVLRWINQFDSEDRIVVLEETNRILKKNYISKDVFLAFVSGLVTSEKFSSNSPRAFWNNISLCNIQINGNSQSELVELLNNEVYRNYGVRSLINGHSEHHIYIDDFLFSGNRLISDMRKWISESAPAQCHVSVVMMGWYQGGIYYVQKQLKKIALENKKNITFKYWSKEDFRLDNRLMTKNDSHVFWPEASVAEIPSVSSFIDSLNTKPKFRVANGKKNKVFSVDRRSQYEAAMLKAGIKILGFCDNPNIVVKPLGYNRFDGFGFGSTVFSYRNCPNNNPLAFWWGDPTYSSAHPFGKWYPLMQRSTYGN